VRRKTDRTLASRAVALPLLGIVLLASNDACVPAKPEAPAPAVGTSVPASAQAIVAFKYDSLDERPVSSEALHGRPSVVAFVTTWDIGSQAQVDFLVAMAKNDGDKNNYALVALQERQDREIVELYRTKLGVTFPVALADRETIAGGGPFGDVHNVPTVVILDRQGHVVWQKVGLAKSEELRNGMKGL
jgi:hypothetical protein